MIFGLLSFAAMTFFGAIYYIFPRVSGIQWPWPKLVGVHFWCSVIGVSLYALSMMAGGLAQGRALFDPAVGFLDALGKGIMMFRVSTMGDLLLFLGAACMMANINSVSWRICRECCDGSWAGLGVFKTAEVKR